MMKFEVAKSNGISEIRAKSKRLNPYFFTLEVCLNPSTNKNA